MLAISPAASAAISTALDAAAVPEGAGLRLAAGQPTERGIAIELAFEPTAAELLDDQVLDAEIGPNGGINFTLQPQGPSMNGSGPSAT